LRTFEYHVPGSLDEAVELLAEYGDEAKILAGGTALVIMMRLRLVQPSHLVSLGRIGCLAGVVEHGGALRVGGLTTLRELETSGVVAEYAPVIRDTLRTAATVRIRNMATIGGSVAHGDPALDLPVALTVLDASIRLRSKNTERVVPIDGFFRDYYETVMKPDEVLTEVLVPPVNARTAVRFIKFLPRTADDYATVSTGARVTLDESGEVCEDVRIAVGACAAITVRARKAEQVMRGNKPSVATLRDAALTAQTEVDPISDARGSAEYKTEMVGVFVRRALEAACLSLAPNRPDGMQDGSAPLGCGRKP
jgi:carbon-monoxide dehydrogenase medium subunit